MHTAVEHGDVLDNVGHDMNHHANEHDSLHDDMMKMYFHGGYNEIILFSFWHISTVRGLVGSMIGCFLLGVLYEGLKFLREFLVRQQYRSPGYSNVSPSPSDTVEDSINSSE